MDPQPRTCIEQPIAADNRLPFMGNLAFDRTSQDFVPFKTTTDAMLASLMLAYRLASPILTVVLALVRHPNFNPAEITLTRAEDVWARVSEHEARMALEKRNSSQNALPFCFPAAVLHEIIDILEDDRRAALYAGRDLVEPQLHTVVMSEIDADLRSMSLVCRDWRRPAQRALGRILILQDPKKEHIQRALNGPLFGFWTREIIMLRHVLRMEEVRRIAFSSEAYEMFLLISNLLLRLRNARSFSLGTDWCEWPMKHVRKGVLSIMSMRELRLTQIGEIPQLFSLACDAAKECPTLEHVYLQYSGSSSVYAPATEPPPFDVLPQPAFKKLSLKIGGTSERSLHYVRWLTQPRENGERSFRLQSLSLDLTTCYRNDRMCLEALEPCLNTLEELSINCNGLSETSVSRILQSCTVLRKLKVAARHTFERAMMDRLPQTLEDIAIEFSFEKPEWKEWDQRSAWFIRTRMIPLKRIRMRMLCAGGVIGSNEVIYQECKKLCAELGIDAEFTCVPVGSRQNL